MYENIEKTFVMIKPDGIKRGLVGKIFTKFEGAGLKLVASRMIQATKEQAIGNYPADNISWLEKMGDKTYKNYANDAKKIIEELGTSDKLEIGKKVLNGLVNYLTSGPVVIMVWEGNHAITRVRNLIGETDPLQATAGSIRGDWGYDSPMLAVRSGRIVFQTLMHASDSKDDAEREIKHWFGDKYKDLSDYDRIDYIGAYEAFE